MKLSRALIISAGLNVILAATLFTLRSKPSSSVHAVAATNVVANISVVVPSSASMAESAIATNTLFDWSRVASTNYHVYVANLRAMDCPERLVADIITADIGRLYRNNMYNMMLDPLPPWANRDRVQARNKQRMAMLHSQSEEARVLIKEVLGYDWDEEMNEWDGRLMEAELAFLPKEKVGVIERGIEKTQITFSQIYDESKGILIDEDFARMKEMGNEMYADLTRLLTPEEISEFTLRTQFAAMIDEVHLDGVSMNGTELREIADKSRILKDVIHDGVIGYGADLSTEEKTGRQAEFDKQVAEVLGPQRAADYQLAQDPNFQQAFQFTAVNQLPRETAVKLNSLTADARNQAEQIQKDKTLSTDERTAALQVLAAATQKSVTAVLGSASEKFFEENGEMLGPLNVLMEGPQ